MVARTFKPEFTIVIFVHYKPQNCCRNSRLVGDEMTRRGWQIKIKMLLFKQFHDTFCLKTLAVKTRSFFIKVKGLTSLFVI